MKTDITSKQLKDIFLTKQDSKKFLTKQDGKKFLTKQYFKKASKKFATKKDLEKFVTKDDFTHGMSLVATKHELQEVKKELKGDIQVMAHTLRQEMRDNNQALITEVNNTMNKHMDVIAGNTQYTRMELAAMKLQTTRHDKEIKYLAKTANVNLLHI